MLKYEYVNIKTEKNMLQYKYTQHKEIIDDYAKKGYRYVGFIPALIDQQGIREIDLVFELQTN